MMKNILMLSASPRNQGNSDLLCEEFRKGAEQSGNHVEKIKLYDQEISFCRACYACFQTGHCVIKDDMESILDKIQTADVLVVATPTYFLSMNGMLKTAIDRFLPRWQHLGGHEVYLIITGHDGRRGLRLVEEELREIFRELGNNVKETIWGEGVWKKGEVLGTPAMKAAYTAGNKIY
jgi:multimeric flavodoxin WrbA